MAGKRRDDDRLKEISSYYLMTGNSRQKTSAYFGIPASTLQNIIEDSRARGYIPTETTYNAMPESRRTATIGSGMVIVGGDCHYWPGSPSTAHRAFVSFIQHYKPKIVILNGDVYDGASISRHPRIRFDEKPSVKQELEAVSVRLQEIEEAAGSADLYWTFGNHDARFETFLAANAPQYEGVKGTSLKDWFPRWKPCYLVDINEQVIVKHRFKGGVHAPMNNSLWAGRSVVTNHLHSQKVYPLTDYNGTRWGVDTGCIAACVGPQFEDYLEGNPTNWRSGFAVLTFLDGEMLDPELVRVRDEDKGEIVFRGTVSTV